MGGMLSRGVEDMKEQDTLEQLRIPSCLEQTPWGTLVRMPLFCKATEVIKD